MNPLLDNVYVINLERSTERLKHIDTNLKKYHIKYNKINAVDGKNLSTDEIKKNTAKICRYLLCNKSVVGCAMSHYTLWSQIANSSKKWHLVLEDDAEFTDDTLDFFDKLIEAPILTEHSIYINLTCTGIYCSGPIVKGSNDLLIKPTFPLGTSAYLITNEAAKKLYDDINKHKIRYTIDFNVAKNAEIVGVNLYATKNYVIKLSSDNINTTIGSVSLPIFNAILNTIGLERFAWYLSIPMLTINMSFDITGFKILLATLFMLNFFLIKSVIIYTYIILELVIVFILANK